MNQPNKERVLFLYASPRSGHKSCADAIRKTLAQAYPDVETTEQDTLSTLYPTLGPLLEKTYLEILKRTPQIWDFLYDNPDIEEITREFRQLFSFFNQPKVQHLLDDSEATAVVCTHAIPCGVIADQKRRGLCKLPLVAVVTDFAIHSYWIRPEVDLYLVANEESRRTLLNRGIAPSKVKVTGIPIAPGFKSKISPREARRALRLDEGRPAILLMGGTRGMGPIAEVAEMILAIRPQPQLLVATGTNRDLEKQLAHLGPNESLRILNFSNDIPLLMSAADVLVTKPGGLTSSEALAKNLPMVIVNPIPGQEERNTHYLIQHKSAVRLRNVKNLKRLVQRLLARPDRLHHLRQNAAAIAKPDAPFAACREILKLLNRKKTEGGILSEASS